MIAGVDSSQAGELDKGSDRDSRVQLCTRLSWCVAPAGHDGKCRAIARLKHAPVKP